MRVPVRRKAHRDGLTWLANIPTAQSSLTPATKSGSSQTLRMVASSLPSRSRTPPATAELLDTRPGEHGQSSAPAGVGHLVTVPLPVTASGTPPVANGIVTPKHGPAALTDHTREAPISHILGVLTSPYLEPETQLIALVLIMPVGIGDARGGPANRSSIGGVNDPAHCGSHPALSGCFPPWLSAGHRPRCPRYALTADEASSSR